MNDDWLKAFDTLLDKVDSRFKSMREDLLLTLRSEIKHGEKGDRGERGEKGEWGEKGDPGQLGHTGPPGGPGPAGPRGESGEKGDVGPAGPPGAQGERGEKGEIGRHGVDGIPGERGEIGVRGEKGDPGDPGRDGRDGTAGRDGTKGDPGRDGKDGSPGRDGITPEQLEAAVTKAVADTLEAIEFDGRTWKFAGRTVTTPAPEYKGVWHEGTTYERGDMATWAGSLWHCNAQTGEKPGPGDEWTLAVKRGANGKDMRG